MPKGHFTYQPGMAAADVRMAVDAAREPAMANFERDWGTRDVRRVASALSRTIPNSSSPGDAAQKARALLRVEAR